MKPLKLTILAMVVALAPAGATFLTIHHDSQKRLDFTFDWHDPLGDAGPFGGSQLYHGFSDVTADWQVYGQHGEFAQIDLDFYVISPLFHENTQAWRAGLYINYSVYPTVFSEIAGILINEHISFKLAHDQQSVRFVAKEKDFLPDIPNSVPDGGSTLLLLSLAMGMIFIQQQRKRIV